MPRLLALEWSETEARFAVAASHGDQVTIHQAFAVAMRSGEAGAEQPPADVGQRIAEVLAERKIGRIDTLVAIGRSSIELRQLTLPPAPDEELPEMVRFTAMREFNALEDDWPLDYLSIDDAPDQPRSVLAAAISSEMINQILATCQTAGLKPRRLVLRPCGAASLYCRQQTDGRPRARLLVELLVDEADLTVIIDRKVIFLRTARLPGDPLCDAEAGQALLAEFRRTMAAVQNQLGGRKVEEIVLCGTGPQHDALAATIDSRLAIPATVFNPFGGLTLDEALQESLPERPGRFAPLLGMLLDELRHEPHGVDFLHPRHRPAPPSKRKYFIGAAAGVAVLLLLLITTSVLWCMNLDSQMDQKRKQELTPLITELDSLKGDVDAAKKIEVWKAGDPIWLDELRWFVNKLPKKEQTVIDEFTGKVEESRGAEIKKFHGQAIDTTTTKKLEDDLKEPGRTPGPIYPKKISVRGGKGQVKPYYPFEYEGTVSHPDTSTPAKGKTPVVPRG